jgi:hypothetical protein
MHAIERVLAPLGRRVDEAGAALIFAAATSPLTFALYERDKATRKQCPDCCESVKVAAQSVAIGGTAGATPTAARSGVRLRQRRPTSRSARECRTRPARRGSKRHRRHTR